jgi:hypothetical protein
MSFVPMYDLESLNEQQRQEYVKNVCAHMGVPDNLNLVMLTYLDDGEGPRRLVAYAKRGAAEIIRSTKGINVTNVLEKVIGGSIMFTVTGVDNKGHQEIAVGSKWIQDKTGKDLDDAIMTAHTRALRRMTLQFVGAGVLDESEVNPNQPVTVKNTTSIPVPSQPIVQPTSAPGNDVTVAKVVYQTIDSNATLPPHSGVNLEVIGRVNEPVLFKGTDIPLENIVPGKKEVSASELEEFKKQQDKLRADAIASLNAAAKPAEQSKPEEPPKPRRGRRPRVDMGPSVPPPAAPAASVAPTIAVPAQVLPAHVHVSPGIQVAPTLMPSAPVSKAKLSPEQVKPYRQRLFKLVNDQLEPAGFAPKEGIGNADKMRSFATMMFSEVTNMNELTVEQWEKYLTTLEGKVKAEGAAATVKYIEGNRNLTSLIGRFHNNHV